jgi:hypothetical protein
VERQRRDTLNSLIDELRELVPPGPNSPLTHYARGLNATDRRPKHAVLTEAAVALRAARARVQELERVVKARDAQVAALHRQLGALPRRR